MSVMKKIAFVFAGQGTQKVGMGADLQDLPEAEESLAIARRTLELDFFTKLWEGEQDGLNLTAFAQPALFWHGYLLGQILLAKGLTPAASCGLSLGEYTALACAEILDYEEGLKLVELRGQLMGAAVKDKNTGMTAFMTDQEEQLRLAVDYLNAAALSPNDYVYISNLNCPGQIVVAGNKDQLSKLQEKLSDMGVRRAIPLAVEGAFHTPLLEDTSEQFRVLLQKTKFSEGLWTVYSNYDALPHSGEEWTETLTKQMISTVRLEACLRALIAEGIDTFIEIGPGKVISGCLKKIDPALKSYQVSDYETAEEVADLLTKEVEK